MVKELDGERLLEISRVAGRLDARAKPAVAGTPCKASRVCSSLGEFQEAKSSRPVRPLQGTKDKKLRTHCPF